MAWTTDKIVRLREIAKSGATSEEAANAFGVTKGNILKVARRYGICWALRPGQNKYRASAMCDVWTNEDTNTLIQLRKNRVPWDELALHLERSRAACQARYFRVCPAQERVHDVRKNLPELTPEQLATARRLMHEIRHVKKTRIIARMLGVREVQVLRVFYPQQVWRKNREHNRARAGKTNRAESTVVPWHVLAERDRAVAAHLDITRQVFGDPLPGRSALDKRKEADHGVRAL